MAKVTTGAPRVFSQARNDDGSFRRLLVSSIGTGTYTDDQCIYWPRVVMCVPRAVGATECVGHLRLEGARYEEEV